MTTVDDKARAIQFLSQHGAFLITKSGDKVAKYFGISKYTLYSSVKDLFHDHRRGAIAQPSAGHVSVDDVDDGFFRVLASPYLYHSTETAVVKQNF